MENWRVMTGVIGGVVLGLIFLWSLMAAAGAVSVTKKSPKSSSVNKGLGRGYALIVLGLGAFLEAKLLTQDGETLQYGLFGVGGVALLLGIVMVMGAERRQKKGA